MWKSTIVFAGLFVVVYGKLRIIGGSNTDIKQHPYQISLQMSNQHFCGGFLISDNWIVTAAHCVLNDRIQNLQVRVGSSFYNKGGQLLKIRKIIKHPEFIYLTFKVEHDIALIQLKSRVTNKFAKPATLPDQDEDINPGSLINVTGWGLTTFNSSIPEKLQLIEIPLIDSEKCTDIFGPYSFTDNMICAGLDGGKEICFGDSGGPAVQGNKVVGIVSWRCIGNEPEEFPGVYAKVSKYRDWIATETNI